MVNTFPHALNALSQVTNSWAINITLSALETLFSIPVQKPYLIYIV